MMKTIGRLVVLILPVLAVLAPRPASAVVTDTFYFAGQCSDCTGVGHGTLVLTDYQLGQQIDSRNFISFEYDGTDRAAPFTITAADLQVVSGAMIGPMPSTESIYLKSGDHYFYTQTNGSWSLGDGSTAQDVGTSHAFTDTPDVNEVTDVPEPMSLTLMATGLATGLAGTVLIRRRRP